MSEKKYELNDDQLEQVSGGTGVDEEEEELPGYDDGNDALPADQLDHTENNVEIIVDHTVLPDVVTDTLPVRGRF